MRRFVGSQEQTTIDRPGRVFRIVARELYFHGRNFRKKPTALKVFVEPVLDPMPTNCGAYVIQREE
jgi:hypothetical protein